MRGIFVRHGVVSMHTYDEDAGVEVLVVVEVEVAELMIVTEFEMDPKMHERLDNI